MLTLSTSTLTGTDVRNRDGENLGDIKDFMLDVESGRVIYAVLDFGGFLGIGDKYFAVPLEAFEADTTREELVLNVTKDKLENAPGFDKNNWPATPDASFVESVYDFYGQSESYQRSRMTREPVLN
ncbi:MAG TPA: PRC-barrel domain containing protein [Bacteroidetes bacterium]|nr:PRC-barrel domain containing protein [Bacteroidota bacterium]